MKVHVVLYTIPYEGSLVERVYLHEDDASQWIATQTPRDQARLSIEEYEVREET